ncbi:MAG: PD-(D/E)XK nuclease family protein, partial [Synergistaceae bacterium]|nr:PD-(D/E)XK nuclease family protein [Synergistaceae bacterium]
WILERWPKNNNYEAELEYYLNDREIVSRLPASLRRIWRDKKSKLVLNDWLMNFAASDLGQELIKNNFKREFSFRVKLAGGATALAGAMDAFFENRVIDYKITSIENVPEGLYESQLDFYALAAHELTGAESVETCTAFLREGKFFERECKNFDDIKARVLRASELCASGPFEVKHEHCASCPFKKGCVKYHE